MGERPKELLRAYEAAQYKVLGPRGFSLGIGRKSREILTLFADKECECAAFLTAWNPLGKLTLEAENLAAADRLTAVLREKSLASLPGLGIDPSGDWPDEPSRLVLGMSRVAACAIGNDFRQNAIVWIGPDGIPELVVLRSF